MADKIRNDEPDANRDPITKEPGSHPIGTAAGGSGGALAGAAIGGAVGGPVGAVIGGAAGAIAGGLGGHAAGEAVNPTVEDTYWREHYRDRPYVQAEGTYEADLTAVGHIQSGGVPTSFDRILAARLGIAAVEALAEDGEGEFTPYHARLGRMLWRG